MKTLLTVPMKASTSHEVGKALLKNVKEIDAYEIWLDSLTKRDLNPTKIEELVRDWKKLSKKKLVVVCKDPLEMGSFNGTQREKMRLLTAAAGGGADYIDIGLHAGKKWIQELKMNKKNAKLIVSFHDFEKTPSAARLRSLVERMKGLGADVIKIATFVNTLEDTQNLIDLALCLKKEKQKHIILGMGEKGMETRILGNKLGNELEFVSLGVSTAPGQMSLEKMVQLKKVLNFEF